MFDSYYFNDLPATTYNCQKQSFGKCNHCGNCHKKTRMWGTTKNTCKKRKKNRSK